MRKAGHPLGKWRNAAFLLAALVIAAADQFSKIWIRANLAIGQSMFETGFLRLTHVSNTGAAFGLFQGQSFLLTIVALVGIGVLLIYAFLMHRRFHFLNSLLSKSALGLVLGGTVGNLIDRLRFGYVTDFIDFGFWPTFNIADSAIVTGVIIFAYSSLRSLSGVEK